MGGLKVSCCNGGVVITFDCVISGGVITDTTAEGVFVLGALTVVVANLVEAPLLSVAVKVYVIVPGAFNTFCPERGTLPIP